MGTRRADARTQVRANLRDPVRWTEVLQLLKTVVAAVAAWVLASQVFSLPQAFLAPWAALLVVHATVYRTFSRGLRQVTGAVLGVVLAWLIGNYVGLTTFGVSVLLVVGLVAGSVRWFRDESTAVAATGLIVLTTGFSTQDQMLLDRLFDTSIGILVGLAVNLVVWPPLRDYSAARAIDAIDDLVGELLRDMAERLREATGTSDDVSGWVDRTRDIDGDLDQAWALLRQAKESGRLNPRRAAQTVKKTDVFEEILRRNEQAVAELRSMARTLGHSIDNVIEWEPEFRDRWVALLTEAGEAIGVPDSARVVQVRVDLAHLAEDLSTEELSARHWPEYGALIMNLRNVVASMDRVAEQNPVVLPRYARRDRLLQSRSARSRPPVPRG
ncbi:aromatic acid exporter family protein [soil metagenome]